MDKNPLIMFTKLQFNPQQTTLKEAQKLVFIDTQESIPFLVWLLENPGSRLALPGKINLHNHDALHGIFGLGTSLSDEAFLIGLTMGSDTDLKSWHIKLFKFVSEFLYPDKFRFRPQDFYLFDLGLEWGRKLKVKNLNKIDFSLYEEKTIAELRDWLDVHHIVLALKTQLIQPPFKPELEQFSFG